MKSKVLVSRCLLGHRVRYDAGASGPYPQLLEWQIAWQESAPLLIGLVLTLVLGEWLVSRALGKSRLVPVTA